MIPLHQLPLSRWRKIMREDKLVHAQWVMDKLNDPVQAKQMAAAGWDLHQMKTECEHSLSSWRNWQVAEAIRLKRQRWIYGFITSTVLALIGFLVMGGCR